MIDLNRLNEEKTPKLKRGKIILKLSVYFFCFFLIAFLIFYTKAIIYEKNGDSWVNKIPIIGQIKHLAESADKELKGERINRINILLLGMGGKQHQGGYLTDTIILASLEPSTKKVALLSIPRDLTVPIEGRGWRKINNINAFAEFEEEGVGGLAVCQALSDLLEIPIDYYVRVDFEGFVNIVDEFGGLEIEVENTLDDYSYPIAGRENAEPYESRFEHLHVDAGLQEMNGELALKFARSRHAYGIEGSDFARAKRQQKIIEAAKNKLLESNLLLKPTLVADIISELSEHVSTNLKIWEIAKLWTMFKDVAKENIINTVLDNSADGLLTSMITAEGAYVLTPKSGDFDEIKYLVQNISSDAPAEDKTKVTTEATTIEVKNGTWINGLAGRVSLDLEKYGFDIIRINNCSRQNFQKSVIYDLTYGEKIESLTILKEKTNANISFELPQWLIDEIKKEIVNEVNPEQPDFILILGQNADFTSSGLENTD